MAQRFTVPATVKVTTRRIRIKIGCGFIAHAGAIAASLRSGQAPLRCDLAEKGAQLPARPVLISQLSGG
jgi:hypothetical protein